MPEDIYSKLLSSIESDRVVILCGAGLSMAAPSNLPSAKALANECYDKYEMTTGNKLDSSLRDNLDELAKYFIDDSRYQDFINVLIPWAKFRDNPNNGHESIADFLESKIIGFVVSTNYDTFIEDAARNLGEKDFRATTDANTLSSMGLPHNPLLKIHGCCLLERLYTVWHLDQLSKEPFRSRIENAKKWLETYLREKHLVFVGFWSDWYYLNSILESCLSKIERQLVVLVNPSSVSDLEIKAPELLNWARKNIFHHEPVSGNFFLDELRRRYGVQFIKKIVYGSKDAYERKYGKVTKSTLVDDNIETKDTYNLRQYFYGFPNYIPVTKKQPESTQELLGIYHIHLIEKGAILDKILYKIKGKSIRMINGAGKLISTVKKLFEKDNHFGVDITLCIGGHDDITPSSIIRASHLSTVVRSRDNSKWITEMTLDKELGI